MKALVIIVCLTAFSLAGGSTPSEPLPPIAPIETPCPCGCPK